MEITKATVLQWLTDNRRSQKWLAEQCEVTEQAVSNWFRESSRGISANAQLTIRRLMDEDAAKSQATPPHSLVLEFSDPEYAPIERAALADGKTVRDWAKRLLNEAANLNVESFAAAVEVEMQESQFRSMAAEAHEPGFTPAPMAGVTSYREGKFKGGPRAVPDLPQAETAK